LGVLVGVELRLDALAHLRGAAPVQVPQHFLEAVLVEDGQLRVELVAVHPVSGHSPAGY
jgi:hypothetical protein